jgi:hypothetical protein
MLESYMGKNGYGIMEMNEEIETGTIFMAMRHV